MIDNKYAVWKKFQPVFALYGIGLLINFITRLVLFIHAYEQLALGFKNIAGIFFIGAFYDICFLSFVSIPIILLCWLNNDSMYKKPWLYILFSLLGIAIIGSFINNPIPKEYDKKLPVVLSVFIILLTGMYFLLSKKSVAFRNKWRTVFLQVLFFIILFLFIFNIVSEYTFGKNLVRAIILLPLII